MNLKRDIIKDLDSLAESHCIWVGTFVVGVAGLTLVIILVKVLMFQMSIEYSYGWVSLLHAVIYSFIQSIFIRVYFKDR